MPAVPPASKHAPQLDPNKTDHELFLEHFFDSDKLRDFDAWTDATQLKIKGYGLSPVRVSRVFET